MGMIGPARTEVKTCIGHARDAGIRPYDHRKIPKTRRRAIAETFGMLQHRKNVLTGAQLDADVDEELKNVIEDTAVFAAYPLSHKMRL